MLSLESDIHIGDEIVLRINQKDSKWKVIGISKELFGQPAAYTNSEFLAQVLNNKGYAKNAMVVINALNSSSPSEVAKLIEQNMLEKNMDVNSLIKILDYRKIMEDHLLVLAIFLILMSILVVLVGGLGLSTTISINTLERTREIAIMRALGASTYSITAIIITEGIIIGIISFLVSLLLSVPLSQFVSYNFGMVFFECPLEPATSILGYLIWFFVVIIFAALASFYPSWKASEMSVRNAVSYE